MHTGTGEMYRKTGNRHKGTIVALFVAGVGVNILLDPPVSSIIFIGAMATFTLVFTALYGLRSRWNLTPAGRAQFWAYSSFSALAVWIMVGLITGPWTYRNEVRDWLFLLFALGSANLLFSLWSVQHREITDREYADETDRREALED